jgi:hypothetical protein
LWSHCHARSRPLTFGLRAFPPFVRGGDAVFFVSSSSSSGRIVCDCVFVVESVRPIGAVERTFRATHPVRHYHFDHGPGRSPHHRNSTHTRLADPALSFVVDPPMPLGAWIARHVTHRKLTVLDYFATKKRKNVRIITANADALYDRLLRWCRRPGHSRRAHLPMPGLLSAVPPAYPARGPIVWP